MQKSGLVDTMWDLIVDTVSALVIRILGWRHLKRDEIRRLVAENPERIKKPAPRF